MLNDRSSHENDPGLARPSETPPAAAGSPDHGAPAAENVRDITAGGSTSRRKLAVTGADFASAEPPLENDKTVISKGAPVAPPTNLPVPMRPHEMGRELEGQRLNHFMLEEFVGGGGMGAVFRAIDTELGRTVAVKVVSKDATDDEVLRRFKNEAQSAARLDHPNIARVYYVGQDRGWNYIVFEYIEGVNVRDLVDHKGPLSLDEAVHYTRQVAEALDHASRRDVVHRDIKPSNVLVMPDGRVKLVDMGLARLHQVEASSQDLTASGVTLGTFDYISPEQARDPRNTDVRSDLYSLGCTIYFMLTGLPPFPEGTVLQKLLSHSSEEPPDPRRLRGDLPDELVRIVMKLLAKQPEKRYQRPSELIGELILLADDLGLPHSDRSGPVWVTTEAAERNWLERHLPWIAPTGILLAAVLFVELSSRSDSSLRIPDPKLPAPIREASAAERRDSLSAPNDRTTDSESSVPSANEAGSPSPNEAVSPTVAPPVPSAEPPSPFESARASTTTGTSSVSDEGRDSTPRTGSAGELEAGNTLASATTATPSRSTSSSVAPPRASEPRGSGTSVPTTPTTTSSSVANGNKSPNNDSTSTGNSTAVTEVVASAATSPMPSVDLEDMRAQEALNERVRTIVVGGSDMGTLSEDAYRVDSLSKAARLLPQMANVREIVLASDSFIEDTFTLADHNLEIRAADGFQPLIVFGRNATNFSDSRQMIRMVGGGVTWRGVQFRLEVPTMLSGSVALFGVNQVETLKFDQCAMTIVNAT
ncbi:MAG: protein kinase, partial [Planctomycetales bacterium]|nr:protein kinase [Planctomycetales bacterium]